VSDFRLSPHAFQDIDSISKHIAQGNLDAADRLRDEFFDAFEKLAEIPGIGHLRKDLAAEPLRFWLVYSSYLVIYKPDSHPLEIVRVLHSARDIKNLL